MPEIGQPIARSDRHAEFLLRERDQNGLQRLGRI